MACFTVPMTEAIIMTIVEKSVARKEKRIEAEALAKGVKPANEVRGETIIPWSRKFKWLNTMLWGGAFLLALEHIWHGEVVPWPPFLTAMKNPADIQPMLHEIETVGVTMAILVTVIWFIMTKIADNIAKRRGAMLPLAAEAKR